MRCPECGTEYQAGAARCPACGAEAPEDGGDVEWDEMVTVLETPDPSLLLVAKSLLDAEDVRSFARSSDVQESLGAARVAEADIPVGPGRLLVRPDDAERARELLASLQPLAEGEEPAAG